MCSLLPDLFQVRTCAWTVIGSGKGKIGGICTRTLNVTREQTSIIF
jgi:hypothetical protein